MDNAQKAAGNASISLRGLGGLAFALTLAMASSAGMAQKPFINEFHYDNAGADVGEFVEIAGPAGLDLAGWELVLYNGSDGQPYKTEALAGVIPDENGSGFGAIAYFIAGLQNDREGIALFDATRMQLAEFISYEGILTAEGGPANGATSEGVGLGESGTTPVGSSLQRTGSGSGPGDFSWTGPFPDSPGLINTGQQIFPPGLPRLSLGFSGSLIPEDSGLNVATGTIMINPAPPGNVVVTLVNGDPGEIAIPATVIVPPTGVATFPVDAVADGMADRDEHVRVIVRAPGHVSGDAIITILNVEMSGDVLFSQYIETSEGTAPKAVEILNNTGRVLDFSKTPFELHVFRNGSAIGEPEALVTGGTLNPFEVMVVGDSETGLYLLANGFIRDTGQSIPAASNGHSFVDNEGNVGFVKAALEFNGNDAMQIQLEGIRSDTFGTPGQDPGTSWIHVPATIFDPVVSTADQNLAIIRSATEGSRGFSNPTDRFDFVADGTDLRGFGVSPSQAAPFSRWAIERGYPENVSAETDSNGDGTSDLFEYTFAFDLLAAVDPRSVLPSVVDFGSAGNFLPGVEVRRRKGVSDVRILVKASRDLLSWERMAAEVVGSVVDQGDGSETVIFSAVGVEGAPEAEFYQTELLLSPPPLGP